MKVYVMRHGLTEMNKQHLVNSHIDEPLSPEGITEVEDGRDHLPPDIKRIYTSSLLRARQTAEIINERYHVPISYHDAAREIHLGSLAGKKFTDMEKEHGPHYGRGRYIKLEYDYRPFGGESVAMARKRAHAMMDFIKKDAKEGPVLLVSHGGTIRLLEYEYNKKLIDKMPNLHMIEIGL